MTCARNEFRRLQPWNPRESLGKHSGILLPHSNRFREPGQLMKAYGRSDVGRAEIETEPYVPVTAGFSM